MKNPMTDLIYLEDSYVQTFSARVIGHDEQHHGIFLDQTAFYPGGGGQPADQGWITIGEDEIKLIGIKRVSGKIAHLLPEDFQLPDTHALLEGRLDWTRRYQLMRTHTAMHILCGTIFRDYGASVTGGNMEPLKGRMDFEFASLKKEFVQVIEQNVNQEIENALPVSWRTIPRDEAFQIPDLIRTKINLLPPRISEVRVVEIDGLDLQADGGTHVKNTSEVGKIRIADYKSKGRENKRIYLEVIE
jgi:misacylated tRNA(Ala) deacylase